MIRKFYITMTQKGLFNEYLDKVTILKNFITFEKTTIKQTQIVVINESGIIEFDKERQKQELKECGICTTMSILNELYNRILGIDKHSFYRDRNLMRELITEDTKEGYKAIKVEQIEKKSDKAYFIKGLDTWIPNSQCIYEQNILYIKDWVFFKNLM